MKVLLFIFILLPGILSAGGTPTQTWVGPYGPIPIHADLVRRMEPAPLWATRIDKVAQSTSLADGSRVILPVGLNTRGELETLDELLKDPGPVVILARNGCFEGSPQRAYYVKLLAARPETRVIQIVGERSFALPNFLPLPGQSLAVYRESQRCTAGPYPCAVESNLRFNPATDHWGRDVFTQLLFEFGKTKGVRGIEYFSVGGGDEALGGLFAVLAQAKFQGFQSGSPPLTIHFYDLTALGERVGQIDTAAVFGAWKQILVWLEDAYFGRNAEEYLDIKFGECRIAPACDGVGCEETSQTAFRKWREGELRASLLPYAPEVKHAPGFYRMRLAELAAFFGLGSESEVATVQSAWQILAAFALSADAMELARLDRRFFASDHVAQPEDSNPTYGDVRRRSPKLDAVEIAIGNPALRREWENFRILHANFQRLISKNPHELNRALYVARRRTFEHGLNFGGRWKPLIDNCPHAVHHARAKNIRR